MSTPIYGTFIYVYSGPSLLHLHSHTRLYSTTFCGTSSYVFSGPSLTFYSGNECMATLHSSDRDSTLLLHLHFGNIYFSRTDNTVNPQILLLLCAHKNFVRTTLFLQRLNSEHFVNIFVTTSTPQASILSSNKAFSELLSYEPPHFPNIFPIFREHFREHSHDPFSHSKKNGTAFVVSIYVTLLLL
jgi:hypothetical protein